MRIEETSGISTFLKESRRIVITNHINPDGDAMGSAIGLSRFLRKLGHKVTVVVPNDYPEFLKWMQEEEPVVIYDKEKEQADPVIADAELIFILDYNAIHRSGEMESALSASQARKMLIDHHQSPTDFTDWMISDTSKSSTAEMVYDFMESLGPFKPDLMTAEALYSGIVTDTGSFRFSSTSSRTHEIAAQLLACGVKPHVIYNRVFDDNSQNRLLLLGRLLSRMVIYQDKGVALLSLTAGDLREFDYQKGDSEGFVNYGLSVRGIQCSIFIREDVRLNKISLRSKGDRDVNLLARAYFNGGGHKNAAGGSLEMGFDEALNFIRTVIDKEFD